jgi:hypothetical protein
MCIIYKEYKKKRKKYTKTTGIIFKKALTGEKSCDILQLSNKGTREHIKGYPE